MPEIRQINPENANVDRDKALDALFAESEKLGEIEINLPSKGHFYSSKGKISIEPLTFAEEQKILSSSKDGSDLINTLIKKCVNGVDVNDLLLFDRYYLLMKLREASYGPEYKFSITCPHCDTETHSEINLSDGLFIEEVPDDLEDPRTVKLPRLGVEAVVRFPRVRDEGLIADNESAHKNTYKFVKSLDGNEDPVFISKALKRMSIVDMKTLIKEINRGEYGVDPRFVLECPTCKTSTTMAIPLDIDFFSVS